MNLKRILLSVLEKFSLGNTFKYLVGYNAAVRHETFSHDQYTLVKVNAANYVDDKRTVHAEVYIKTRSALKTLIEAFKNAY